MIDFKRNNWLIVLLLFSLFAIGLGTVHVHAASDRANNAAITNPIDGIGEAVLLAEPTVNLAPTSIISSSTTFSGIAYVTMA